MIGLRSRHLSLCRMTREHVYRYLDKALPWKMWLLISQWLPLSIKSTFKWMQMILWQNALKNALHSLWWLTAKLCFSDGVASLHNYTVTYTPPHTHTHGYCLTPNKASKWPIKMRKHDTNIWSKHTCTCMYRYAQFCVNVYKITSGATRTSTMRGCKCTM